MSMNLAYLRTFLAVADTGSISGASRTLFRAQSAVTRAVQEFELLLDTQLFERRPSGIVPTSAAEAILPRAHAVMQELAAWSKDKVPTAQPEAMYRYVPPAVLCGRRLEMFSRLLRCRHMPTVAKQVGVSQPAVSAAISSLEACISERLFVRTTRGLSPTDHAALLGQSTRRALNDVARLRSDIALRTGEITGEVAVGALPLARASILPEAIAQLVAAHPNVLVSTVESPFEDLCAALRAGELDFIVGALRDAEQAPDFETRELFREPLAIVVRRGHPLTQSRSVGLKDLAGYRWITPRRDTPARTLLSSAFAALNHPEPTVVVETGDAAIVRRLLAQTDLLAAVSASQMSAEIGPEKLRPYLSVCPERFARFESHGAPAFSSRRRRRDWRK
ncbi:LysR family transcriptional regulator [Paraburkholderia sp. MM5477-R1]|uniref:LysR family transcriptional regulator n=1 Tax=Paraburkholderia sp. MM5477-R1 TaxID=2991062 RepID=UPI003D19FE54